MIDKVIEESKFTAKGIVLKDLEFLKDGKLHIKTTDILPNKKFYNQLENQFINGSIKNELSETEFENRKNIFLESADAKMLLYCLSLGSKEVCIITEETEGSNDNKQFKKLPAICNILNIEFMPLPKLIELYNEINLVFK